MAMKLLAGLGAVLGVAVATAAPLEDMIAFERVYIPALALTNQPLQPEQRVAASVKRLESRWPALRASLLAAERDPINRAVAVTDTALVETRKLLAAGDRTHAHEALESVRPVFMKARSDLGIELYVDRLTEYHDPMETLVRLAADRADPARTAVALERAADAWRGAERIRFEPRTFGFDDAALELLRRRVREQRELLETIQAAVLRGDREIVADAANRLKTGFSRIYMSFGDFEGL